MEAVLCYVYGEENELDAYFTTQPLGEQWGDEWNDAPYEHNAVDPYRYMERVHGRWCQCVDPEGSYCYNGGGACGKPGHVPRPPKTPWEIILVEFDGPYRTPCAGHLNSQWSVQQINQGECPWLQNINDGTQIMAGTTLSAFKSIIAKAGGTIISEETLEHAQ